MLHSNNNYTVPTANQVSTKKYYKLPFIAPALV